jgi:diguanylate cyclase
VRKVVFLFPIFSIFIIAICNFYYVSVYIEDSQVKNHTLIYLALAYIGVLSFNLALVLFMARIFEASQNHRQKLLESQYRINAILETAQDAIISAGSDGNIVGWNKGAETIFGYKASEVMGKPLTVIMPQRYQRPHLEGLGRFVQTGKPHLMGKIVKLTGLRKNGTEFYIELSLSTWKSEGETFFTAIIRDITHDTHRNPEVVTPK